MGDNVQVHLSKPGGEREGPYSLAQIKADLAAKKYRDTDFWAWYTGLPAWVPLYDLPGIAGPVAAATPPPPPAAKPAPAVAKPAPAVAKPAPVVAKPAPVVAKPAPVVRASPPAEAVETPVADPAKSTGPEEEPVSLHQQLSSAMPFSNLEQMFIFTTGKGPTVWESDTASQMFRAVTGQELATIRAYTPRDVVSDCDVTNLLGHEGSISDAVWRAMTTRQPDVVQRAKKGVHRVCVRTFRIEDGSVVALILFYKK